MDWFLYNRLWGVGVFTLIENIGLEPTEEVSDGSPASLSTILLHAFPRQNFVGLRFLWCSVRVVLSPPGVVYDVCFFGDHGRFWFLFPGVVCHTGPMSLVTQRR